MYNVKLSMDGILNANFAKTPKKEKKEFILKAIDISDSVFHMFFSLEYNGYSFVSLIHLLVEANSPEEACEVISKKLEALKKHCVKLNGYVMAFKKPVIDTLSDEIKEILEASLDKEAKITYSEKFPVFVVQRENSEHLLQDYLYGFNQSEMFSCEKIEELSSNEKVELVDMLHSAKMVYTEGYYVECDVVKNEDMSMHISSLSDDEYNALNKIATATKMDCWFNITSVSGCDLIEDLEEGRIFYIDEIIESFNDGIVDSLETDYNLTTTEVEAYTNLLNRCRAINEE